MDPVPWREAWHDALYAAERGFYVARGGPAAHFTTAAHGPTGRVLAEALLSLWAAEHGTDLPSVVVDVGAGRGELATHLVRALDREAPPRPEADVECAVSPRDEGGKLGTRRMGGRDDGECAVSAGDERGELGTRVVAVDVVDRPEGLDQRVEWLRSPGGAALPTELSDLDDVLVIAHEWLDVVPCTVAEVDATGALREVLVDPATGEELLGAPLTEGELRWARDHWTTSATGDRVEVGLTRDLAWAGLVSRVRSGTVVAVDYGHTAAARPRGGTLTAYADGGLTRPVPDGSCDLTAHVAMDTLDADTVRTQREALRALGVRGATPRHELATSDPLAYLAGLERAGAEARLLDRDGFGGFWWAVKQVHEHDVA